MKLVYVDDKKIVYQTRSGIIRAVFDPGADDVIWVDNDELAALQELIKNEDGKK